LLESAGAAEAKLIIICLGEHEPARKLVTLMGKHYPHLKIAVAAEDRRAVYEFMDLGVVTMRRKTFYSSLALRQDALQLLGYDRYEGYRLMRLFRKKDEDTLHELYRIFTGDGDGYISMYRQHNHELAELMVKDQQTDMDELDKAWPGGNPYE
jgi:hypothetical protein